MDTPETHKPGTPVQCFGEAASHRMANLLPVGTAVRLVYDRGRLDRGEYVKPNLDEVRNDRIDHPV